MCATMMNTSYLVILKCYRPAWTLASCTIHIHSLLTKSLLFLTPILPKSTFTSCSHRLLGLPTRLTHPISPSKILFGCLPQPIFFACLNPSILPDLINLTIPSFIIVTILSYFTGP